MGAILSWSGINLCQITEEFETWLNGYLPPEELEAIIELPNHEGNYLADITINKSRRHKPKPVLNSLWYPVGASFFCEGYFLLSEDGYQQYLLQLEAGENNNIFILSDGINVFTTTLYALPPCPLTGLTPSFYLLPLVDERYWWQFQPISLNIDTGSIWLDCYETIAEELEITLEPDSIDEDYQQPCPFNNLNAAGGNAALLFDAITANLGQRVVRNYDGSYRTMNVSTSNTTAYSNYIVYLNLGGQLAGGLMFAVEDGEVLPNDTINDLLPSSITVYFPEKDSETNKFRNPVLNNIPNPLNTGDYYSVTINLNELEGYEDYVGNGTTKVFYDTFPAEFDDSGSLENEEDLTNLAAQLAWDYCSWLWSGFDLAYNILDWVPEGSHDLIFTFRYDKLTTRVRRLPYNFTPELMNHWDGSDLEPSTGSGGESSLELRLSDGSVDLDSISVINLNYNNFTLAEADVGEANLGVIYPSLTVEGTIGTPISNVNTIKFLSNDFGVTNLGSGIAQISANGVTQTITTPIVTSISCSGNSFVAVQKTLTLSFTRGLFVGGSVV